MKNMKVSQKLVFSFLLVIFLSITVGVFGIIGMSSINKADDTMYRENLKAISAMGKLRESLQRVRVSVRNLAIYAENKTELDSQMATIKTVGNDMIKFFDEYESTIADTSMENAYYDAKKLYQNWYVPFIQQAYEASLLSREDASSLIFADETAKNTNAIVDGFTVAMDNNERWAKEAVDANTALFMQMTVAEIVILVVAVAFALFLAFYISGLISKPLNLLTSFMVRAGSTGNINLRPEDIANIGKFAGNKDETGRCIASTAEFVKHIALVSQELETLAGGDLTVNAVVLSQEDTIGIALQKMVENLNNMFGEIASSTAQVSTGSKQIADGAQTLAQGSTQQAAAVEQLSSSISEVADKTKANADMAERAANLANMIKNSAEKGSRQMGEMMDAVKEINQASQSISKVIGVIDNIAFQTNILALNAAVEAARAGQHGKGFAVVAEEVRSLASKSSAAAKDTGALITSSIEKAELGARIADETSASLVEIVSGINESSKLVGDIARSSAEQTQGIGQINTGINQVAQVIQQNSATAEESAAASEEMSGQADMLETLISQFKLKDDGMNRNHRLPTPAKSHKRLSMPERSSYAPETGIGDYGKY